MKDLLILIADENEKFVEPLELKFFEGFRGKAKIEIITDKDYFNNYFNMLRNIYILIVSRSFYSEALSRHNIDYTFILSEDETDYPYEIYKYTSVQEIYRKVVRKIDNNDTLNNPHIQTKIVTIYSPIGGSGKTTIASGICGVLTKKEHRVIYISTETYQALRILDEEIKFMSKTFEKSLSGCEPQIMEKVSGTLGRSRYGFEYLLPLNQASSLSNIGLNNYFYLINKIKDDLKYDYIVIDVSSELNTDVYKLMNIADKVVLIVNQNQMASEKVTLFLNNIDCSDTGKFSFVCNRYNKNIKNHLMDFNNTNNLIIKRYIREYDDEPTVNYISDDEDLKSFVYGAL